ncbi:hypothetical protein EJ04DRAFT_516486 [Polyplosphaeria fusca]|uniref:Sin3-associated polypeptide Sap18 n=1 Tax=Polyplosphaeria fusca TaxID=682080 RepID=A0A9P4QLN1_9PLEO|nr:hypothetical protein EJ04DRAFT_516486 [Polyplosphaeria fusca]
MASYTPAKIDRQTTTPFLLHLFYKTNSFHRLDEFSPNARLPPHLQIYTWPSCSLSELTHLLLTALPSLLAPPYAGTRLAFRMVFADLQSRPGLPPRYISRELGSVVIGASSDPDVDMNGTDAGDAEGVKQALKNLDGEPDRTFADAKFVIGDYVCCAILPPLADGSVASAPPAPAGPAGRGPPRGGRENGFGARGDHGYGRGRGAYGDRRPSGGVPSGEWRRGEAPPISSGGGDGYWRGGGGGGGRGRGRGRW